MSIVIILWLMYFILKAIYRKPAKKTFYSLPKCQTKLVYQPNTKQRMTVIVESFRKGGQFDFVKVQGINSKEEALEFKGYEIQALKDYQIMDKDTYYFVDLVGCKVLDDKGTVLGKVSLVEEFPAQLTLRVKREGNQPDFLVPFVKAFIKNVDIKKKEIIINVIGGLL